MPTLRNKTVFITGATRGIGEAIALRVAKEGANVVITGKTDQPHKVLPGTIHSVAKAVEEAGGQALPLVLDVRDVGAIDEAVSKAAAHFGGIDVLVNNASAINLTNTLATKMTRFDLMMSVNVRATFAASRACIPYLSQSENPHILTLSPPLNMEQHWFKDHLAYTYSKYGMSMCTLGMSAEFKEQGIAVNSLWPKTTIATAAIQVHFPPEMIRASRKPAIVADAAYYILSRPARDATGQFYIDEEVLLAEQVSDLSVYAVDASVPSQPDLFL